MTLLDARPEAIDVNFRPGSTVTLNLSGPADWLDTRDFTATLNGTALSVSKAGDVLVVSAAPSITTPLNSAGSSYPFVLTRTGGNVALVGTWKPSENAAPATTVNAAVLVEELDVAVTILGSGEGGSGGVVDTIVAGDGIDVDSTDPQNPIVSATATGSGTVDSVVEGHAVTVDATDPANPVVAVDDSALVLTAGQVSGTFLDNQIPASIARDSETTAAIAALSTVYQPLDSDLTAIAALATTSFGRGLLTQADAAATRTTLGLGTAATQATGAFDAAGAAAAAQAASQPLDSDLTAIASLTTTSFGRAFLTLADAAAARTALALGTAATTAATAYATAAQGATADSAVQPGDLSTVATTGAYGDLSGKPTLGTAAALDVGTASGNVAALSTGGRFPIARIASGTPDGSKFVRDDGTLATPAGGGSGIVESVVAGDNIAVDATDDANPIVSVTGLGTAAAADTGDFDAAGAAAAAQAASQPLDSDLTAIAALTSAANKGLQSTGAGTWALYDLTAAGKALMDDADAAAQRTTLGLGTLATQSGTFSGTSSGTNTGDQTITLTGDATGTGSGSFAVTVANDAVTNAKLANVATATFKGRTTAGTGDPEDLTVAQAKALLNLTGTNSGDQTITLTGDVTGSGTGSFAATIANDSVTYAKMQNVSATSRIMGRATAGAGDMEELTASQTKTILAIAESDVANLTTDLAAKMPLLQATGTGLATTGTVTIDMSALHGTAQLISITGNITFATSNRADGEWVTVIIVNASGSSKTLAYPSWVVMGAALPSSVANGKTVVFTVRMTSTADSGAIATGQSQV